MYTPSCENFSSPCSTLLNKYTIQRWKIKRFLKNRAHGPNCSPEIRSINTFAQSCDYTITLTFKAKKKLLWISLPLVLYNLVFHKRSVLACFRPCLPCTYQSLLSYSDLLHLIICYLISNPCNKKQILFQIFYIRCFFKRLCIDIKSNVKEVFGNISKYIASVTIFFTRAYDWGEGSKIEKFAGPDRQYVTVSISL